MKHKLAEDTITHNELKSLSQWMLEGNRLTKGEQTLKFEAAFNEFMGSKHSIFVNSGSSANLLSIYSAKISGLLRNNIAIAPAVSWVTTVTPLLQFEFQTHLCDADPVNLGLDVNHFEDLCRRHKPSIAILVHVLGHSNNLKEILEICQKYNVMLIEDSCEALGSTYGNKKLGKFGLTGTFSFYYGHHVSTIEGGMVVTDDDDFCNIMKSIRSHGWSRDLPTDIMKALQSQYKIDEFRNLYTFYWEGFNLRSTDLQAFIGQTQLKKLPNIGRVRNENMVSYRNLLPNYFKQSCEGSFISNFAYGTLVQNPRETYQALKDNGIETRPLICGNIARHPFWLSRFGKSNLKIANQVHDYGIYLPNHANLDYKDIYEICEIFSNVAVPYHIEM